MNTCSPVFKWWHRNGMSTWCHKKTYKWKKWQGLIIFYFSHFSGTEADTRRLTPFNVWPWNIILGLTWSMILTRSSGAVMVRDTAPAIPPATRCRHHIPDNCSFLVNSGGTVMLSPMSIIYVVEKKLRRSLQNAVTGTSSVHYDAQ